MRIPSSIQMANTINGFLYQKTKEKLPSQEGEAR